MRDMLPCEMTLFEYRLNPRDDLTSHLLLFTMCPKWRRKWLGAVMTVAGDGRTVSDDDQTAGADT